MHTVTMFTRWTGYHHGAQLASMQYPKVKGIYKHFHCSNLYPTNSPSWVICLILLYCNCIYGSSLLWLLNDFLRYGMEALGFINSCHHSRSCDLWYFSLSLSCWVFNQLWSFVSVKHNSSHLQVEKFWNTWFPQKVAGNMTDGSLIPEKWKDI